MMKIAVPMWVLALLALAIVLLIVTLWSVKRRRRPHLELEPTGLDDLQPSIAGLTQGTCVDGNRVELLQNGAMWDRVFEDLAAARETINYETFLCKEGELTRRMAEAGVNIEVLYSDHDHQLILVVDDVVRGRAVAEAWSRESR